MHYREVEGPNGVEAHYEAAAGYGFPPESYGAFESYRRKKEMADAGGRKGIVFLSRILLFTSFPFLLCGRLIVEMG